MNWIPAFAGMTIWTPHRAILLPPKIVSEFGYLALQRESSRRLKRVTDAEQGRFIEVLSEKLQANGQTVCCLAAWHRDTGNSSQIGRDGEDVRQVHGQRIAAFLAQPEGRRGRRRRGDNIHLREGLLKILFDERSHFLGLQIIGIVIAGAQNKSAKDDAALHLIPKPRIAGLTIHPS